MRLPPLALPALLVALLALTAPPASAQVCPEYNPKKNPYFGDLHVHTSYSLDAYGFGTRREPPDAFAFARNQLSPKLDFSVVSDHSEMFDTMGECVWPSATAEGTLFGLPYCQEARQTLATGSFWSLAAPLGQDPPQRPYATLDDGTTAYLCAGGNEAYCQLARQNIWQREVNWAQAANSPCQFTTFPAYEWSATPARPGTPDPQTNATLHRIVLFSSGSVPSTPLDAVAYPTPLSMLSGLDQQCKPENGCEALAIPHNTNQSMGLGFLLDLQADLTEGPSKGLEALYRAKYEKLLEVFQHKGASECLYVDPTDTGYDPRCAFENTSWLKSRQEKQRDLPGYARAGLTKGLRWHAAGAVNPFQFGFVGATDTHNGTPGNVSETTFQGHAGTVDDTPEERARGSSASHNPGGLTVAWAEENTRASLFAAFKRREVYATSGPRVIVRFYQTWDQTLDPCADPDFPAQLLQGGAVPMGATMPPRPNSTAKPRFVVHAMMDQARLQELHLFKVSVTSATAPAVEQLTVASSPDPAGMTVWCKAWTDDSYDPTAAAYYYARVLEVPTWRFSHYDCEQLRVKYPSSWQTLFPACDCTNNPGCIDRQQRERAWTSPIWALP